MAKKSHPQKKACKDKTTGISTPASHSNPAISAVPSHVGSGVPSHVTSAIPSCVTSTVPSHAASAAPSHAPSTDSDSARDPEGSTDGEGLSIEEVDPVKALGVSPSPFFNQLLISQQQT